MRNIEYSILVEDVKRIYTASIKNNDDLLTEAANSQTPYRAALKKLTKAELKTRRNILFVTKNNDDQSLDKEDIAHLKSTAFFTDEEKDILKVNKKEKVTISAQMGHVIMTSTLGFGSAVLGFFAFTNPVTAIVLGILFVFGVFGSRHLVKTSLDLLRKTEKQTFEQAILSKMTLDLLIVLNEKVQNKIDKKLIVLNEKIKDLIGTDLELSKENMSGHALARLKDKIEKKYNIKPKDKALHELLDKIKHIKHDSSAFLSRQESTCHIFSNLLKTAEPEDTISLLTPGAEPPSQYSTFRGWLRNNWSSAEQTGMSNSFGTTAGNMVFPAFLIALATTNLAVLKTIGISSIALAMTTPLGFGITIGVVLLIGLTVAGLSLYSKYRSENRNSTLKNSENSISNEKEKNIEANEQLTNIDDLIKVIDNIDQTLKDRRAPSNIISMPKQKVVSPGNNPHSLFSVSAKKPTISENTEPEHELATDSKHQQISQPSSFDLRNSK